MHVHIVFAFLVNAPKGVILSGHLMDAADVVGDLVSRSCKYRRWPVGAEPDRVERAIACTILAKVDIVVSDVSNVRPCIVLT